MTLDESWWEQITWQSGQEAPRRECNSDCYGAVHSDKFLLWREKEEPPILGNKDLRALLVARDFLNQEQLGKVVVRRVQLGALPEFGLSSFKKIVSAWLKLNPSFKIEDLVAQLITVQYIRPEH